MECFRSVHFIIAFYEKGGIFTFYEKMNAESRRLETQIDEVRRRLEKLPEGNIFCTHDGNQVKWYRSQGKHQTYISKRKDRLLAEQLAEKKYLSFILQDLLQEKKAIDCYLKHCEKATGKAEQMLVNEPAYRELLSKHFKPLSQELQEWMVSSYDHNALHPEKRIIKTTSGNLVRSKSEALIDMTLQKYRIPFRYECALQLDTTKLYPDFTIRHPKTGEIYYWEHFGMMDDPEYRLDVSFKLRLYINNGIIPTYQLITTYESGEKPLGPDEIDQTVRKYFL